MGVTPMRKRDDEELRLQTLLFDRRLQLMKTYPDLRWLFASLNGVYIPPALLKQVAGAGLVRGVFDVFLPVVRRDRDGTVCPGLVIEMKKLKGGRPSPEQLEWAKHMIEDGWRAYFCAGAVDAWRCIACYLEINGVCHEAPDLQRQEEFIRLASR